MGARARGTRGDHDLLADQARFDAHRHRDQAAALEDDRVLDLAARELDARADRREWADVGVGDVGALADHEWAAQARALDRRARADPHNAFDRRRGVDAALDLRLERRQHHAVPLQHVLDLAGVLPPTFDDVRAHALAGGDELLDGVGDLELATLGRPDGGHRVEYAAAGEIQPDGRQYD